MLLKNCDGCGCEMDLNSTRIPYFMQKAFGKEYYFCQRCNKFWTEYKSRLMRMYEKFDEEKEDERIKIKKEVFLGKKSTLNDPKPIIVKRVTQHNKAEKARSELSAEVIASPNHIDDDIDPEATGTIGNK